jgi:Domain of unknown function (DUF4412)
VLNPLAFVGESGMVRPMKKTLLILAAVLISGIPALAQMGGGGGAGGGPGANFDNGMEKLFAANPVFAATMQTKMNGPNGPMTVKSKMFFDHENSRTEMNMADAQGGSLPPDAISQMQTIGMDKVVSIALSDKKTVYMVYPNIRSYVGMDITGGAAPVTNNYQVQTTKIGDDSVDGHTCVKNQTLVWSGDQTNVFTVWNATDLNNFPIQITMSQQETSATIDFQNVSFDKLDGSLFQPPAGYTKYGTIQDLMQSALMNHPGGMPGMPGAPTPSVSTTPNQ